MGFHGKQVIPGTLPIDRIHTAGYVPVAAEDLTNVAYVQALFAGLDPKDEARLRAVGNVNIAAPPTAFDTITAADNDRIVLGDQTTPAQNGIYNYHVGGMVRSTDFDGSPVSEVKNGAFVFIREGATWGGFGLFVSGTASTPPNILVGTDPIVFSILERKNPYVSNNGITKTGNLFQLGGALVNDTELDGNGLYDFAAINLASFEAAGQSTRMVVDKGGSAFRLENVAATEVYLDIIGNWRVNIPMDAGEGAGEVNADYSVNLVAGGVIGASHVVNAARDAVFAVGAISAFAAGWTHEVGDGTGTRGRGAIALGIDTQNFSEGGITSGVGAHIIHVANQRGGFVHALNISSVDGLKPPTVEYVIASSGAVNISRNTAAQTVGQGALAQDSAILGGIDHHVPTDSPRSVILGGSGIEARAADPDQVYVPNLNIMISPSVGVGADDILALDAATGEVKRIAQASIAATLSDGNGTTANGDAVDLGGVITGDTDIDLAGFALTWSSTVNSSMIWDLENTIGDQAVFATMQPSGFTVAVHDTNTDDFEGTLGVNAQAVFVRSINQVSGLFARIDISHTGVNHGILITDTTVAGAGAQYAADYSANYTDRSLVDKEYVDNAVTASVTANSGLTKTLSNIVLGGALLGITAIDADAFPFSIYSGIGPSVLQFNDGDIVISTPSKSVDIDSLYVSFYAGTDASIQLSDNIYMTTSGTFYIDGVASLTMSGSGAFPGAQYAADYSANYTDRSLIDKEYADNLGSSASNGLTKTGVDIQLGGPLTAAIGIDVSGFSYTISDLGNDRFIADQMGVRMIKGSTTLRLDTRFVEDSTFITGTGFDFPSGVLFIKHSPFDGMNVVVGQFNTYNGIESPTIAKISQSGEIDTVFATNVGNGINNPSGIRDVYVSPFDGSILIAGGNLGLYNGNAVVDIFRLNSDGTQDNTFSPGSGSNSVDGISRVGITSTGQIVCVGNFTIFDGNTVGGIVRLHADGSSDASFNVIGSGFDSATTDWALYVDGADSIYVGNEDITTYNGAACSWVVKLDDTGAVDATFNTGSGFAGVGSPKIMDIKALGGQIYIGGTFNSYNGVTVKDLIRVGLNGALDGTYVLDPALSNVLRIDVTSGFVIGWFQFVSSIRKLTGTGSIDTLFASQLGSIGSTVFATDGTYFIFGAGMFRKVLLADQTTSVGTIVYDQNYASVFTNRSLVDKEYVDNGAFIPLQGAVSMIDDLDIDSLFAWNISADEITLGSTDNVDHSTLVTINRFTYSVVNTSPLGTVAFKIQERPGLNNVANGAIYDGIGGTFVFGSFGSYQGISVPGFLKINNASSNITMDASLSLANIDAVISAGQIRNMAVYPDSSFIIVGNTQQQVHKFLANGDVDPSFAIFGMGFEALPESVNAVAITSSNQILLAGDIFIYNITSIGGIIQLNSDGSIDDTFVTNTGTGFNVGGGVAVEKISVQPDGKIICIGSFTQFDGVATSGIARLNADGTLDTTFTTNIGLGFVIADTNIPYVIELQADGKILIGGSFSGFDGELRSNLLRLNADGTLDTFNDDAPSSPTNGPIYAIKEQPDGQILVGGTFSFADQMMWNIIRLNPDGTTDSSLVASVGTTYDEKVTGIAYDAVNSMIFVVGEFSTYNGQPAANLLKISNTGVRSFTKLRLMAQNTTYDYVANYIDEYTDRTLADWGNVKNHIGGIGVANSILHPTVAQQGHTIGWTSDGVWNLIPPPIPSEFSLADGNGTTVGGTAVNLGGVLADPSSISGPGTLSIAVRKTILSNQTGLSQVNINYIGYTDPNFANGSGANSGIIAITRQTDGKIIIGGDFSTYNGVARSKIARLNADGTLDTTFNPGTGFNNTVKGIVIQSDGKIVVVGAFTTYNSVASINRIVRLNTDGTRDTSYGVGTGFSTGSVIACIIQTDDKVLAFGFGGNFNGTSGLGQIVRINTNGTRDTSLVSGTGFNGSVYSAKFTITGHIIVVGDFTTYKGVTQSKIARINSVGALDTTLNLGTGFNSGSYIMGIDEYADGRLILTGNFITYDGNSTVRILRISSTGAYDATLVSGAGFTGIPSAVKITSDEKIMAGGNFSDYDGNTFDRFIRLNADGSIDTTLEMSNVPMGGGGSGFVSGFSELPDGGFIVIGNYAVWEGLTRGSIVKVITRSEIRIIGNLVANDNYHAAYTSRDYVDYEFVTNQIGGKPVNANIVNPTIAVDGFIVAWNQTNGEYELIVAPSGGAISVFGSVNATSANDITIDCFDNAVVNVEDGHSYSDFQNVHFDNDGSLKILEWVFDVADLLAVMRFNLSGYTFFSYDSRFNYSTQRFTPTEIGLYKLSATLMGSGEWFAEFTLVTPISGGGTVSVDGLATLVGTVITLDFLDNILSIVDDVNSYAVPCTVVFDNDASIRRFEWVFSITSVTPSTGASFDFGAGSLFKSHHVYWNTSTQAWTPEETGLFKLVATLVSGTWYLDFSPLPYS